MVKTSMSTKNEIIEKNKEKYLKASKKQKSEILNYVCNSTGLSRDRAARRLNDKNYKKLKAPKKKRGRKIIYGLELEKPLSEIWMLMDFACSKILAAGINDFLDAMARYDELQYEPDVVLKLKSMSAFTMDKLLKPVKRKMAFKGKSTTKPGTLLKKDIPIRLGTEWDDAIPGFVEVDLVAHCGSSAIGEFVSTLDMTDISTGWTETRAVINKAQKHVFEALIYIKGQLPFPLKGIDSDNGSEFINAHLFNFCKENNICFTRSRPNKKNDNCYIEQKNWAIVRKNIGYDRYEGKAAVNLLNSYYERLRFYTNFFLPQTKLIEKTREGSKIKKKYEKPLTPYQRVLNSEHISLETKQRLTEIYYSLNPVQLKREMVDILEALSKISIPWNSINKSNRKQ